MEGAQGGKARRGDGRVCPACGEVGEAVVDVQRGERGVGGEEGEGTSTSIG